MTRVYSNIAIAECPALELKLHCSGQGINRTGTQTLNLLIAGTPVRLRCLYGASLSREGVIEDDVSTDRYRPAA